MVVAAELGLFVEPPSRSSPAAFAIFGIPSLTGASATRTWCLSRTAIQCDLLVLCTYAEEGRRGWIDSWGGGSTNPLGRDSRDERGGRSPTCDVCGGARMNERFRSLQTPACANDLVRSRGAFGTDRYVKRSRLPSFACLGSYRSLGGTERSRRWWRVSSTMS